MVSPSCNTNYFNGLGKQVKVDWEVRAGLAKGGSMNLLHRSIALLCVTCLLSAGAQERSSAPDPRHEMRGAALVSALLHGGYTLYFRHTATDFSQNDTQMDRYDDCSKQRNLNEAGRAQARAIGESIRALKLPVGEVLASPYCRTMETARLIFGTARASSDVRGFAATGASADYSRLEKILSTPPKPGTLRAIASHGNPFRAIAGPPHLEEGEAAVIKSTSGGWVIVARVRPDDWLALQAARQ